jgi:hypothetical protein
MSARLSFRLGLGLFLVLAVAVGAAMAGIRVKLEDVPKPAVKLIQDRFPRATIRYVDREAKDRYEFALKEGDRLFDVGVMADGKLVNVKEEIPEEKLPKAVKEGVLKKYPGAKIVEVEKVLVGDGKEAKLTYELAIKVEKKTLGVVFDEAGKFLGDAD